MDGQSIDLLILIRINQFTLTSLTRTENTLVVNNHTIPCAYTGSIWVRVKILRRKVDIKTKYTVSKLKYKRHVLASV